MRSYDTFPYKFNKHYYWDTVPHTVLEIKNEIKCVETKESTKTIACVLSLLLFLLLESKPLCKNSGHDLTTTMFEKVFIIGIRESTVRDIWKSLEQVAKVLGWIRPVYWTRPSERKQDNAEEGEKQSKEERGPKEKGPKGQTGTGPRGLRDNQENQKNPWLKWQGYIWMRI